MGWTAEAFDLDDAINQRIWQESPGRQHALQSPRSGRVGDIGAAQALVGRRALPWVPDLVGRRWREPTSILVFGSSYADFFSSSARRSGRMRDSYSGAANWASFQRDFVDHVVRGDASYYRKVLDLVVLSGLTPSRIVLTDLCRASFVALEEKGASASESVLTDNAALFNRYVQANVDWHRERFDGFEGHVVVGLGHLATRGILHLLRGPREDKTWLRRRRVSGTHRVRWRDRMFSVVHVPHPSARGAAHPRDGAPEIRRLLGAGPESTEHHDPVPHAGGQESQKPKIAGTPPDLWLRVLEPRAPLPVARLLATHPESKRLTRELVDRVDGRRLVAIANTMCNACRAAMGRSDATDAWTTMLDRRDRPFTRANSKWGRLVELLDPVPPAVAATVGRMDIEALGAVAAALIAGPYREV